MRPFVLAALVWASAAQGAGPYYVSPTGSDAHTGLSPAQAWKTFAFAIPRLLPGETLILEDGEYPSAIHGMLHVDCTGVSQNGTAQAPITVRAANERRAWLKGDGALTVLRVQDCSFWRFEGLRVSNGDDPTQTNNVVVYDSSDLQFRRMLVTNTNRFHNTKLMQFTRVNRTLVEECELYDFHRGGIESWFSNFLTVRRNYMNSRGMPDLDGGYATYDPARGDWGIKIFEDGSDNIYENNISEGQSMGVNFDPIGPLNRNRLLGNIALAGERGAVIVNAGTTDADMAHDTRFSDLVVIDATGVSLDLRSTKDSRCDNCTLISRAGGALASGLDAKYAPVQGDGQNSTFVDNSLAVGFSSRFGFRLQNQTSWQVRNSNAFGCDAGFSPWPGNFVDVTQTDPALGQCLVYLPLSSPMKGKGVDGGDIGANVLYRTVNGQLTGEPLWNPVTGAFPCGAVIPGVNDDPSTACVTVHQRLNVNSPGCPLPPGYGIRPDGGSGGGDGGSGSGDGGAGDGGACRSGDAAPGETGPTGGCGGSGGAGPTDPRSLRVGCGCQSAGSLGVTLLLLLATLRRRR